MSSLAQDGQLHGNAFFADAIQLATGSLLPLQSDRRWHRYKRPLTTAKRMRALASCSVILSCIGLLSGAVETRFLSETHLFHKKEVMP